MSTIMIIRTATEADYSLLGDLEGRSDRTFLRLPGFDDVINQPRTADTIDPDALDSAVFIAEIEEPVGFIYLRDLDDCSYVAQISVVPEAQGKGAGTALLEEGALAAKKTGKRGLTLVTFRDVSWNAPFYARRGFHILDDAEMGPGLSTRFAKDILHASCYGTRCAMGRFFQN